jgi:sugar lactone lactonase YvrE
MAYRTAIACAALAALAAACGGDGTMGVGKGADAGATEPEPTGIPVLGMGAHSPDAVSIETVGTETDGLTEPRDLAFNPEAPEQLWVVNRADNSMVVYQGMGTGEPSATKYASAGNHHFLVKPSSLAFGAPGRLATTQEEDEKTQSSTPADFMGPVLWTSDLEVFDGGHGGHMDMLHNSPNSNGIAWDTGNAYYVFDGYHQSITRYDFQDDHGPGGADHSDGIVERFVQGQVGYEPGVPSHMIKDQDSGLLYIADTGNNRIAVLDPSPAERGNAIFPNYDGSEQYKMQGAELTTLVSGASIRGMSKPSGLALHDGHLFVGDNETGRIIAFDLDGNPVDWLDLDSMMEPGSMMGIAFGPEGRLHVVDNKANRILRLAPASGGEPGDESAE